jgi:hypothetical protein
MKIRLTAGPSDSKMNYKYAPEKGKPDEMV